MGLIAYVEPIAGASGDMWLGALVDAGLDPAVLVQLPERLGLEQVSVRCATGHRCGIGGTRAVVAVHGTDAGAAHGPEAGHPHRHVGELLQTIGRAALPDPVKARAQAVFQLLARAEGAVHGLPAQDVHLHEVGAADALVDIVGTALGLHELGIERTYGAPLALGSGSARGSHGELPVPVPATLELVRLAGIPVRHTGIVGELATPTGTALLAGCVDTFEPPPEWTIRQIGYGLGRAERDPHPNVLRLSLGDPVSPAPATRVVLLETQIDDQPAEELAEVQRALLEAGALDAWITPIVMKKGRSGSLVSVLARPDQAEALEDLLFRETTTFGIRRQPVERTVLDRRFEEVPTPWGPVRIKVGSRGGAILTASPELEECLALARSAGVPLKRVRRAAMQAWAEQHRA